MHLKQHYIAVSTEGQHDSSTKSSIHAVFGCLCPELVVKYLTDDVIRNESFVQCVASSQSAILLFLKLQEQYEVQARRQRKSKLRRELDAINLKIKKLVELIAKTAE